ncbi:hypothetical protein CDJ58_07085 [Campylobacter lari]|uniref:Uncharacterized protein n=1 Tax=Campylobacter peloridis TaxID=488546 RepID=A0A5C7DJE9_9BACT|nr:hypothetical protein [Campylobacter peloridis]EAH8851394.1 hypothetical protein [Campylobacter lari]EAK5749153.1 hypothetical protein [Campylobacter lari]EAK9878348.1 hypothetical protein [Campylobacter lari]TXE78480.1 hypothetical protein FPD46_07905 [Campylobacter peloridis]
MNKKVFLLCFILLIINTLKAESSSTEDFFYQRGYENGYRKGYEEGVKEAFASAKEMLKKYKDELQAYEIGKYLLKNQNLTYPQVWQEYSDGVLKLRVLPSKIEKEINIDELFSKFSNIPIKKFNSEESLELNINEKNSVYLSERDSNINHLPQKVSGLSDKKVLSIPKTSRNLEILKKANVVFSDEGNFYNILFFTDIEKKDFCEEFKICK